MSSREWVIAKIREAFGANEYPGFLQGSSDGCEPNEETSAFEDRRDWQAIEADFLDAHSVALSFFSEAGFRFYLPAYLIADLNGQLRTADPLFHLTHGFSELEVKVPTRAAVFIRRTGKSEFINPRRYGAATWYDRARYRLSVFPREEVSAIVAYLKFKREYSDGSVTAQIEAALNLFWLEREETAPLAASLKQHITEEDDFIAATSAGSQAKSGHP